MSFVQLAFLSIVSDTNFGQIIRPQSILAPLLPPQILRDLKLLSKIGVCKEKVSIMDNFSVQHDWDTQYSISDFYGKEKMSILFSG